jgi:hypothetical protein
MAIGVAPAALTIWMAIEPRPPAPPQMSATSPSFTAWVSQPCSIRQAVAATSVYAAASSHDMCLGLGMHCWPCTLVNWAKLP